MPVIDIPAFSGMTPRTSPGLLGPTQAERAENARLSSGALEPFAAPLDMDVLPGPAPRSLIRHGGRWIASHLDLEWTSGLRAASDEDILYITGLGAPRILTAKDAALDLARLPLLGVEAPSRAPQISVGPGGEGPAAARSYVATFVTERGEEGPPGPPSSMVWARPGQRVDLYGLQSPPADRNVTRRRVYRTATPSDSSALWLFVAEIDAEDPSFSDEIRDAGETLESTWWLPPPFGLRFLTALPNGFLAGALGHEIRFSEPYHPHAWPPHYRLTMDSPVRGLGVFGTTLVAATATSPYLISGSHPEAMSMSRLPERQPCVSRRALTGSARGVAYPSPDGLYLVGPGGGRLLTEESFTRAEWQRRNPASMHASVHDGCFFLFHDETEQMAWSWEDAGSEPLRGTINGSETNTLAVNGSRLDRLAIPDPEPSMHGFILDPDRNAGMVEVDLPATAAHTGTGSDTLDLACRENGLTTLRRWEGGAQSMQYVWRSRIFETTPPCSMAAARVDADHTSGALEFTLLADGVQRHARTLTSSSPFRLPGGFKARRWQVELRGKARVASVRLATSMRELSP